jgi:lipoprotein NlpI
MRCVPLALALLSFQLDARVSAAEEPLSEADRSKMLREFDDRVALETQKIAAAPKVVENYSRRGDAYFFRGRFAEAVADYDKMIELDPRLERQHWRRGIACFFAGEYTKAARQFEIYHTFDDVDRENGIWRYLSQAKAGGRDRARRDLLKYQKDDREPFRDVYRLFAGEIAADEIFRRIRAAEIDEQERTKRLFYAHLYVGLNDAIEDRPQQAVGHLREAVANPWARGGGYGPQFMWHVGRLHSEKLADALAAKR